MRVNSPLPQEDGEHGDAILRTKRFTRMLTILETIPDGAKQKPGDPEPQVPTPPENLRPESSPGNDEGSKLQLPPVFASADLFD
jgi:hypothetical protein